MKIMKKLAALTITLCMVLTLVACGKKAAEETATVADDPTPEATSEAEDTEKVAEPTEAELNIMMSFPQYMEQWETYCKQFEDKMLAEENIKVKVNLEMPSTDQYESVLQARLTGDDAPDLYTIHSNLLKTYNDGGYLSDLSGEELAGKIYDNVKNTVTLDSKLLAVPIESQAWGVLYNKDIFDECGLKAPDTLDDLKNICEVLKGKGYTPFLLAYQEQWVPQLMYDTSSWVKEAYQYVADGRSYQDLVLPNAVTEEQGKLLQEYYTGSVTRDEIIKDLDAKFKEANELSN